MHLRPRTPTAGIASTHAPVVRLAGLQGAFQGHCGFGGDGLEGVVRGQGGVFAPDDFIARRATHREPPKRRMQTVYPFFVLWRNQDGAANGARGLAGRCRCAG